MSQSVSGLFLLQEHQVQVLLIRSEKMDGPCQFMVPPSLYQGCHSCDVSMLFVAVVVFNLLEVSVHLFVTDVSVTCCCLFIC